MTALSYLILFCSIAALSLVVVSIINERERRKQIIRQKLKRLKFKVEELEEVVIEIDLMIESRVIAKLVNDEIIDMLRAMTQLDPEASYLQASLASAEARAVDFSDESEIRQTNRVRGSDVKIARAQHYLTEAGRVLRHQHSLGHLSSEELNVFIEELSWTRLSVDVVSHIAQGHRATNNGDLITAEAFYRRAQNTLLESNHEDTRRHRMIKEMGEILSGRRQFLSVDLMPETEFNPKQVTA